MTIKQAILRVRTYLPWDGDEPYFTAWTDGETWNGFQCPRFEKLGAENVVAHLNEVYPQPQGPAYYDADKDTFFTPDANEPPHFQEWPGIDWQSLHVYAIGAWYWTWDVER